MRKCPSAWLALVVVAGWLSMLVTAQAATLVSSNSVWKYKKGTAEASTPDPTAWRLLSFDDATWLTGPTTFYYGENIAGGTLFSDMQNNYSTIFLRQKFAVTNLAELTSLTLNAVCDDGFAVWINGVLVATYNAPAVIAFNSLATANAPEPVQFFSLPLPNLSGYLASGNNLLAIQVFNVNLTSSDIVFNADLTASVKETIPPGILRFTPDAGNVLGLTQITVIFTEPVAGVDAGDLMVNGEPAAGVSGAGAVYTFTLPQLAYGTALVTWNLMGGITDLAVPPNNFNASGPGTSWSYHLVDPDAPTVVALNPPAGSTVRSFSQVEVQFSELVTGVEAGGLLLNGTAATNVAGIGAGPYIFQFPAVTSGVAQLDWTASQGITDLSAAANRFAGGSWQYAVNSQATVADLVINEFVAENISGLKDEEGEEQDWIEIYNRGTNAVNLLGWSLTDDAAEPGQWVFPAITLSARAYRVVFASGKDRKPTSPAGKLHTNFKLNPNGEFLGLFNTESPRQAVSEIAPAFPDQRNDYSYGRDNAGNWRFYRTPTPGAANGNSSLISVVEPVHFSVPRGFFKTPFSLSLATETPGAVIRVTLDGSVPTLTNGVLYTNAILVNVTRIIRAAAFRNDYLPSKPITHTYLFNLPAAQRSLPVVSLVTAPNNLTGRSGIIGMGGGTYNADGTWRAVTTNDYYNPLKKGKAWERPMSVEFIQPADNSGFWTECGIRVHASDYFRPRMHNGDKFSFTLFFRGDYGTSSLHYPWFSNSVVEDFDEIVLRGGSNDPSNPFLRDQLVRRLAADTGQVAAHGNFVTMFINGRISHSPNFYYNPAERIEKRFCQTWHGGTENWDVREQFGSMIDGDGAAFDAMMNFVNSRSLTVTSNYQEFARQLDLTNFVEYLLPLIYADTGDWPGNNWRAARERVAGARFRFYVWDAEWSFGFNNPVTHNTLTDQLSGGPEIATIYQKLKVNPEFRLLFADRVHKHFFNDGGLTDARIKARYDELKAAISPAISGSQTFDNSIGTTWIPQRRRYVTNHLALAGLMLSSNAPGFSQFGGRVANGFNLTMTNAATNGIIFYTTNGADPRVAFSGTVSTNALRYADSTPVGLDHTVLIRARTQLGTNWSALTEATFQVAELGLPLRITEIMYNPAGGDAYEFLELQNLSTAPLDLSGITVEGVGYRFPEGTPLVAGARLVLIADENPAAFAQRYPGIGVGGIYSGRLSNSGERLALVDRNGRTITSVSFEHTGGWPTAAFDQGRSLEILEPDGDPEDPANWRSSILSAGSPGAANPVTASPAVRFNEVLADNLGVQGGTYSDFVELYNASTMSVDLAGWSFTEDGNARKFVFPANVSVVAGGYLVIWCDNQVSAPGLHAGFSLGRNGESLFLYDRLTNRVDALSYGLQLANYSVGRVAQGSDGWQLTEPTPGGVNEVANLGQASDVAINEFMANPVPGTDDWLELYNQNATTPVALRGLYLGTSNALFQIKSLSFIAPGGFVQLIADEKPGADHLDFKLPAAGGSLVLFDQNGLELNRINNGAQREGVSQGRLPDGTGPQTSFVTTASPGASNYLAFYGGPILNELMARNERAITNAAGRAADWLELYNPNATAFDLSGMSVSVNESRPGQWKFPTGTTIGPDGYRMLWCDGSRAASTNVVAELNLGRSLEEASGGVYLFNASDQLVDLVEYGFQLPDRSIGKSGGSWNLMAAFTPGATNSPAAALGAPGNVRLNEWQANSAAGGDWFEVYNLDALPVNLAGIYLTDDPSLAGQTNHQVGPLSFIAGQGWVTWKADGRRDLGRDHVGFNLDGLGETLRIYSPFLSVIDSVDFGVQPRSDRGTQGRFPDGAGFIANFPTTPSPEAGNYLPLPNVVINEVLTHTDPPLEDAIELFNPTAQPVEIGGWFLSNSQTDFKKYRIPGGTMIPGGGFKVFYEYQFNATSSVPSRSGFTLNSAHGDEVHLSAADTNGLLTGYRASVKFGAAENGVSIGRYVTSVAEEFVAMSARTFGVDNPLTTNEFRMGTGQANADPKVGPVVINEIMYHPVSLAGTNWVENEDEEFIELFNLSNDAVRLFDPEAVTNTWRLRGGIEFVFPPFETLAAQSYLLVVNFDPATNSTAREAFQRKYQVPAGIPLFGPYQGKLSNAGETLELAKPDPPQPPSHPDAGFVPYMLVDRVEYTDHYPWPDEADGAGASLQRRRPASFGNDPLNWKPAAPTAGSSNVTPDEVDTDGDGMPDLWEMANGLDRFDSGDAAVDADQDGLTNLQEFLSGTNPNLAQSVLIFDRVSLAIDGVLTLRFTAVGGKSYTVQSRDDLSFGDWSRLEDIEAQPNSRVVEVPEVPPSDLHQRFYRIVTPQSAGP